MPAEHTPVAPMGRTDALRTWVAHGYRCCLLQAPLYGAINGYVLVPNIKPGIADQVEVHGGVTHESGDWIGFDTLHAGDRWPGDYGPTTSYDRTWTQDQVAAETERMAASAKELMEQ